MLRRLANVRDEEEGFTLIELAMVLLIVAILITMGLPTYIGVKSKFQNRAAQQKVRNTVVSARILFTDNANYSTASASGLAGIEPSTCYVANNVQSVATGASGCSGASVPDSVSVLGSGTPNRFAAARWSTANVCFLVVDSTTGTLYGTTTTASNCTADYAATSGTVTATTPAAGGW